MNRREVIVAGAGLIAGGLLKTGVAFAAKAASGDDRSALMDAALSCIKTGELCHTHCLDMLGTGDKSMADCSKSVTEMLTMCRTLMELAAQKSTHLAQFAVLCGEVCKNCEKACRAHEKHAVCKNCAESCAKCAAECAKIV